MRIFFILIFFIVVKRIVGDPSKNCPTIKTKQQWGGSVPFSIEYQIVPINSVIIQHTVSQKCDTFSKCANILKGIQGYHKRLGFDDIGYNFLIGNDGVVYEGCGWHKVGAHTYGFNRNSTGIAFIGDFQDELPSPQALDAAKKFLACGVEMGELGPRFKLLAASQVQATISPGAPLAAEIQDWDNWSRIP